MENSTDLACREREINWNKELRDIAILFFILGPVTLYFSCEGCYTSLEMGIAASVFSGYYWVALWKGNSHGARWLDRKITWDREPLKRLFATVAFALIYTSFAVALGYYVFFTLYLGRDFYDIFLGNLDGALLTPIVITLIISTFMHGRGFFIAWRQAAVDVERLKSEQLSSKYESLKNQVNPHFLFNSLNALSSLVHSDADLAEKFIKKLSDVYRYVLDSQDKEVVDLSEELSFTESFIFLQKIRHGESLQVSIDIPQSLGDLKVPPLAFQMLIENAIKHNVISEAKPLKIEVSASDDFLMVSNKLQRRSDSDHTSGLGINNIKMRYEYLSDKKIQVEETSDQFTVRIPLLTMKK